MTRTLLFYIVNWEHNMFCVNVLIQLSSISLIVSLFYSNRYRNISLYTTGDYTTPATTNSTSLDHYIIIWGNTDDRYQVDLHKIFKIFRFNVSAISVKLSLNHRHVFFFQYPHVARIFVSIIPINKSRFA